jgi:hypothetical protein
MTRDPAQERKKNPSVDGDPDDWEMYLKDPDDHMRGVA